MDNSTSVKTRFSEIIWAKHAALYSIAIIGLGGIGSWLALMLGRIGYNLTLIDYDKIENHNLGGQLYNSTDIGELKVSAIKNLLYLNFVNNVNAYSIKFTDASSINSTILISAVDDMNVRKLLFNKFVKNTRTELFIDGRMSAEQFEVYIVTKDHNRIEKYKESLFDNSEVEDEPCTSKATSHFGAEIAANITKAINNYVSIQHDIPRELPFRISVEGYLFTTTIEYM